jgi:hypothetical protein
MDLRFEGTSESHPAGAPPATAQQADEQLVIMWFGVCQAI